MKMTKTIAALGILGAALLAFASCKDSSGDGNTTGVISGVPAKYALQMTVDATDDNIKVGNKAITDSNGEDSAVTEILADTPEGKSTATGHEAERQRCGKRFFKEISAGLNNTEGFRTNIVLNVKDGTWVNSDVMAGGKPRTAGAGMLFDFNEYKVGNDKTYDFFFLSFKPTISNGAITGVTAYFERYRGVKKYKQGIYTSHTAASALGSNYIPKDANGTWDESLYAPTDNKTWSKPLALTTDYYLDNDGNAIIGVDVKQMTNGVYKVRIGKITYDVGGTDQTFSPSAFKQTWKTTFTGGTIMGEGGETSAKTGADGCIKDYLNWTHVVKDDKDSNLKGGVLVYGFAPYGTKPIAAYYTCDTKLSSNKTDNTTSQVDYVGDWNVANELDADGVEDKIFYEEGNVVHEYIYY